ncbi:MAG: DNA-binding protein WhiA [Erysipelotrichaceae bacterium]
MSFTSEVKAEIANNDLLVCCRHAELSALIQMCATLNFTSSGMHITIKTENATTAKRIYRLIKDLFQVETELSVIKKMKLKKNNIYVIRVMNKATDILRALDILGDSGLRTHPSRNVVRKDCDRRAYLAGAFLAGGSINSPANANYHMEIAASTVELAKYLQRLMRTFGLEAKYIKRRNQEVVYLKASDQIADFLRAVEANQAVFTFEDQRIQRGFINSLTRLDNCELANEMKSLAAGHKQFEDIEWIENYAGLHTLPEKLKQVAFLRKENPEASLLELCEYYEEEYDATISKSGMRHRLNKLAEIAEQYKTKNH